jgi:adenine-specific DNA-methyltransferase
MPTLHWIGKDKVINHHMDVPYRILEHRYRFKNGKQQNEPDNNASLMEHSDGAIIHGDNLEALKSLLPEYEGRVKCIYIDPPYNTGNEGWVYNDNVSDPKIKKWLGKIVGKESDDLTRHDKWLCMMYPRLKLLNKLLHKEGTIFISIDDIEQSYLKLMCDEIFGRTKFIAQLIWKSRQNKDNRNSNHVSTDHEYVLCYGVTLKGIERNIHQYKNPDNDSRGPWQSANMVGLLDEKQRPNLHYDLINPETGINYGKPKMGWRYDINTMEKLIAENRIIWPKSSNGRPRKKQFLCELQDSVTGYSSIIGENIFTRDGTNDIQKIFDVRNFEFTKPAELIQELVDQVPDKNAIVLDSFAGSGTTAHAVLNLNKQDGGKRKFILVEMEDYAENITAERVKRVINGYSNNSKKTEGTGGSFDYYELGQPLFIDDDVLNEEVEPEKIRQYVWFSETHKPYKAVNQTEEHLLGISGDTAYYFYYYKNCLTTLDDSFLRTLKTKAGQYIIYADLCVLDAAIMQKYHITFKKIPRDITRF